MPRSDIDGTYHFVALDSEKAFAGVLQVFKDGTAAFSREPGVPYTPAKTLVEAFERVFVFGFTTTILACPRCKKAFKGDSRDDHGGEWVRCAECGSQIPVKAGKDF